MPRLTRRQVLALGGTALAGIVTQRLKGVDADSGRARITGVDVFSIRLPLSKEDEEQGKRGWYSVTRIDTDAGVHGYSFVDTSPEALDSQLRPMLVGKDLFAVEDHFESGLIQWGGVEHAVWDAIGRVAGQPVYRLLGGASDRVRAYLTCVWPGNADQSQVSYETQAEMAVRIKKAGFHGMKIRAWRPNPMDDVDACRVIMDAVGDGFALMYDRTAHLPVSMAGQKVWDYETALKVAKGLEAAHAYWLEEPFAREDYDSPARLRKEVGFPITGGEGYHGLEPFRQCLSHGAYDILQPDGAGAGGILVCRKVAALAEAFGLKCALHGTMGLQLAGWLQCSASFGAEWQELALVTPPLLPEELWAPGLRVIKQGNFIRFENGEAVLPDVPGIGLDVDEDALAEYRVK